MGPSSGDSLASTHACDVDKPLALGCCFTYPLQQCLGGIRLLVSELFAWCGFHEHQPATGIELLAAFQRLFLAVGFDLNGGCVVSRLDHQFVEQSHGAGASDPVVARFVATAASATRLAAKSPGLQRRAVDDLRRGVGDQSLVARTSQNAALTL